MESIHLSIKKIEEDIKATKFDIEALKQRLSNVEADTIQLNESIHHNNNVVEALFDI
jgi:hypothetical protein